MTRQRTLFSGLLAAMLALLVVGCAPKRKPEVSTGPPPPPRTAVEPLDTGDVNKMGGEGVTGADVAGSGEGGPMADVRFGFDQSSLTDEARAILAKNAQWLQAHRDARVTVEGHCDERGTVEYNLALGEQRARAARDYLVSLGVQASRLRTVSFGKERPLDNGHGEDAWARNRRAHFAVTR